MNESPLISKYICKYFSAFRDSKIRFAVVLGSGLCDAKVEGRVLCSIGYDKLGIMPSLRVNGHNYAADVFDIKGRQIILFRGRLHAYQNPHSAEHLKIVKLIRGLGIKKVLFTHSAGSLKKNIQPGSWVRVKDHINLTFTNPFLTGGLDMRKTYPFRDIRFMYDNPLSAEVDSALKKLIIRCITGVYAGVSGPIYETRAEALFLSKIGASVVGMSLVSEALCAHFLGIECASLAFVTNNLITGSKLGHKAVVEEAQKGTEELSKIISQISEKI